MVVKAISIIFGVIFIALGYWLLKDLSTSHISIITTIFQGWTGYFITYIGIHMIFSKILEKNKIISFIYYRILVLPVVGLMYFSTSVNIDYFFGHLFSPINAISSISKYISFPWKI